MIRDGLKIDLINDKLREAHLRWFGYVSIRPNTVLVRRVTRLQIEGTRRKRRSQPLKKYGGKR